MIEEISVEAFDRRFAAGVQRGSTDHPRHRPHRWRFYTLNL
jgi:hypothetical protein